METTRRELLTCAAAWAGVGGVWSLSGGTLSSRALAAGRAGGSVGTGGVHVVRIRATHIGFDKEANPDTIATAREAIAKINALDPAPAFLIHTGDLTHAQKPGAFDTVSGLLQEAKVGARFTVPGEHDVFGDGGVEYLARFGRNTLGSGWHSFDHSGVHFVGLVNVVDFKSAKVGALGVEQLDWLRKDLAGLSASTPIVVFVHIPLWAAYPEWG